MEVEEAVEKRRSIRRYRGDPVPQETINKVLEAARLAPSASNLQTWRFKVVTDSGARAELRQAAFNQRFIEQAPVVIVACTDFGALSERAKRSRELLRSGVRPNLSMLLRYARKEKGDDTEERSVINAVINVAIAVENMALTAVSLGLGTCWVRAFQPERVAEILSLPPDCPPLIMLPLGYPEEDPAPRPRRAMEEILL